MVKNQSLRIFGFILALFLIISVVAPISIFAAEGKIVNYTDSNITNASIAKGMGASEGQTKVTNGNVTWEGGSLFVVTKGTVHTLLQMESGKITVYPSAFKEAKQTDVTKAMRMFTDGIAASGGSVDTVQQVMADIQDVDPSVSAVMLPLIFESTKGDMYQAYKITSPFLEILSVVLGVGAVILILLLLFSTVMDLAYIGLPVWRETLANKDGGNSKKLPFGVSFEAGTTVTEIEKGLGEGGYKNAYLIYFKRRVISYIVLSICIMYLIGGGLSGIIGFILNLVSGITG